MLRSVIMPGHQHTPGFHVRLENILNLLTFKEHKFLFIMYYIAEVESKTQGSRPRPKPQKKS